MKKPFFKYKSQIGDGIKRKSSSFSPHKALSMLLAVLMIMTVFLYTGASAQAKKNETGIGSATISKEKATFQTSSLTAGSHTITSKYEGDVNFNPCENKTTQPIVKVSYVTTISLARPDGNTYGDLVRLGASWSSISATGLAYVYLDDSILASGPATGYEWEKSYYDIPAGSHVFGVKYDSDYIISLEFDIYKANATIDLTSDNSTSKYGDPVTFTATMSKPGATEDMHFFDGTTEIGSAAISNGVATFKTSLLAVGSHNIYAKYEGDSNFNPCDDQITQKVEKADVSLSLSSSKNPSQYGKPITFTATLSKAGATGTVTFFDGTQVLGIAQVSSWGTASLAVFYPLSLGDHDIRADYSGDTNYNEASNHMTQAVGKADVVLSLSSSDNPSKYGTHVTFTAALSKIGATGTVSFFDGTTTLGSAPISDSTARLTTSALDAGNHDITAKYSGDAYYKSVSTLLKQTVDAVYTVHYINSLTGKSLADDKTGSGALGEIITEKAVSVEGYVLTGSQTQSITLSQNLSSITFHYIPIGGIFAVYVIFIILLFGVLMLPIIFRFRG